MDKVEVEKIDIGGLSLLIVLVGALIIMGILAYKAGPSNPSDVSNAPEQEEILVRLNTLEEEVAKIRELVGPNLEGKGYVITKEVLALLPLKTRDFIQKEAAKTKDMPYAQSVAQIIIALDYDEIFTIAQKHNVSAHAIIGAIAGLIDQVRRQLPSLPERSN